MRRNLRWLAFAGVSLACVLVLGACNNCAPTLRYLTISPANSTIAIGGTQQYSATLYYSDGSIVYGSSAVTWSSSNSSVAGISSTGLATGTGIGTVTITATAGGAAAATSTLVVNQLTAITVTPTTASIVAGATQQYHATGTYTSSGGPATVDITSLVAWSSATTSVATITSAGLATGVAAGSSVIKAALGTLSATATLTVTPAVPVPVSLVVTPATQTIAVGNVVKYSVQEKYSDGTLHPPATPASITWSSSSTAAATVIPAPASAVNGIALGLTAGTSNITATEGSLTTATAAALTVVTGKTHTAYVANNGGGAPTGNNIGWYSVDVTSATPFTFADNIAATPTQIALHPSNAYLYWMDLSSNVYVYDVASNGSLTNSGFSILAGSGNLNFMAADPYGRFLYVIDAGTTTIYGFTISPTNGTLTSISGAPFNFPTLLSVPQCIIIDPTGNYAYVTNNENDEVVGFSINQTTGVLTALASPTGNTGIAPVYEAMDPSGKHLYVANSGDNTITMIPIGTGGAMGTPVTTSAISGASFITDVVVDPSGTHVYALDGGGATGQVFGFSLNSDGTVGSAVTGSPAATGVFPNFNMVIDPTGVLLATANNIDSPGTISLFTLGSGGALAATTPPTVTTNGETPTFVVLLNAP